MRKHEEKKGHIVRHIQSARQWLERAEHAVNTERATRGELDLILAKAEVQLAQEKRSSAKEMPHQIMTYVFRPQNMFALGLGGLAVCVLLIFNMWHNFGQDAKIPAAHSLQNKTQYEVPAAMEANTPSAMVSSLEEGQENSGIPPGKNQGPSDDSASFLPAAKSNTTAVRSVSEPAAMVQPQTTPVSEQEIRMLMRTAERALKNTQPVKEAIYY